VPAIAVAAEVAEVRERLVERVAREVVVVERAPELDQGLREVEVAELGLLPVLGDGRRQLASLGGDPRLEDHRLPLARPRDVERPRHREELPRVVQGVLPGLVEEDARSLSRGKASSSYESHRPFRFMSK
jgi:hypothetical protein